MRGGGRAPCEVAWPPWDPFSADGLLPTKKSVKETREGNQNDLTAPCGSDEEMEDAAGRVLQSPLIPFKKLCDSERKRGDTELIKLRDVATEKIIEVKWKVYRSEREFDNLFWDLWNDYGEQWTEWMKGDKPRTPWMKRDAVTFAKLLTTRKNTLAVLSIYGKSAVS